MTASRVKVFLAQTTLCVRQSLPTYKKKDHDPSISHRSTPQSTEHMFTGTQIEWTYNHLEPMFDLIAQTGMLVWDVGIEEELARSTYSSCLRRQLLLST
jgi:hypothetical protein